MKKQEGSGKRIEALPVNILRMLIDPSFQNALKFGVTLGRCKQIHVLVTARNINFNLKNDDSNKMQVKYLITFSKPVCQRSDLFLYRWPHTWLNKTDQLSVMLPRPVLGRKVERPHGPL
jgi:hypothetical protein